MLFWTNLGCSTQVQLYGHLPPLLSTRGKVRRNLLTTFFYGLPHMNAPVLADHNCVDAGCSLEDKPEQWMIGTDDKRDSGNSVLSVWFDDDDDIWKIFYQKSNS